MPPDPAPRSDRGQRSYSTDPSRPDERFSGGYSNDRYQNDSYSGSGYQDSGYQNERPASGYPNSGRQSSGYPDSGYADSGYPESGYADGNYREPEDPIPGFPRAGDAAAFAPGARSRPRNSHSRSAPSPGSYPQERSSGRPPRRKLSIPLIALAVLIVLIVVGALLAHRSGGSSHSMGPYRTSVGFSSAPQAVTSG
jgi:hypothetical protein